VDVLHDNDIQHLWFGELAQQSSEQLIASGAGAAKVEQFAAELTREVE